MFSKLTSYFGYLSVLEVLIQKKVETFCWCILTLLFIAFYYVDSQTDDNYLIAFN